MSQLLKPLVSVERPAEGGSKWSSHPVTRLAVGAAVAGLLVFLHQHSPGKGALRRGLRCAGGSQDSCARRSASSARCWSPLAPPPASARLPAPSGGPPPPPCLPLLQPRWPRRRGACRTRSCSGWACSATDTRHALPCSKHRGEAACLPGVQSACHRRRRAGNAIDTPFRPPLLSQRLEGNAPPNATANATAAGEGSAAAAAEADLQQEAEGAAEAADVDAGDAAAGEEGHAEL